MSLSAFDSLTSLLFKQTVRLGHPHNDEDCFGGNDFYTREGCLQNCYDNRLNSHCGCTVTVGELPTSIFVKRGSSGVNLYHTEGFGV